ncbi:MAG: FecR domain-containing protein [Pseudomonadota bacterium]
MTVQPEDLPEAVIDEATSWLVRLKSGSAVESDVAALTQWRASSPERETAWQRLMEIEGDFQRLAPADRAAAQATLERVQRRKGRRATLKLLFWAAGAGGVAWGGAQTPAVQRILNDHVTGVGQSARILLSNGTELRLNSRTAVDLDGPEGRVLHLRRGEIHLATAPDTAMSLRVETAHGVFAPMGTRFLLRDLGSATRLAVLQDRVRVTPRGRSGGLVVGEGQAVRVSAAGVEPEPLFERMDPAAWLSGHIVVRRMALGEVLAELSAHHPGFIHAVPEVAGLLVSGVYRIDAIDDALLAIEASLPVRVSSFTPYLVIVRAL